MPFTNVNLSLLQDAGETDWGTSLQKEALNGKENHQNMKSADPVYSTGQSEERLASGKEARVRELETKYKWKERKTEIFF